MKLPKKKFKVRLSYAHNGYFYVQYAYYRFVPIWRNIMQWDCILKWTSKIVREHYRNEFDSIEDVRKYHQR